MNEWMDNSLYCTGFDFANTLGRNQNCSLKPPAIRTGGSCRFLVLDTAGQGPV